MKKILLLMSALMLAAFTSSCEGTGENGSGNGPETVGGTFVAEGISASFKYATDFYKYREGDNLYLHILTFSNKPIDSNIINMEPSLDEGERFDVLFFYYLSENKELQTCEMTYLKESISPELPSAGSHAYLCMEGTSDPETPKKIHSFLGGPESGLNSFKIEVSKENDSYSLSSKDILMDNSESGGESIINGTFKYKGVIISEQNNNI